MIKAPEFYDTFHQHADVLEQAGFKRKSNNKYTSRNGNAIQIILNKWGWTEEYGWSFFIRLVDIAYVSRGPQQPHTDIDPMTLADKKLISPETVEEFYKSYNHKHPGLYENIQIMPFAFYDQVQLKKVLDQFLPAVAQAAKDWEAWRFEQRDKPAPAQRSPVELAVAREAALRQMEQAGLKVERPE